MNSIIPIFVSDGSISRSILTSWPSEDKLSSDSPVSIWTIAKIYDLKNVYIRDTSFCNFISHYKESQKLNKQLIFGIKFKIYNNQEDPKTESVITVWMNNSEGYKDLCKLYSEVHAKLENSGKLLWSVLKSLITPNLSISLDFYNSFLARNLIQGHSCIPDFGDLKPVFELSECKLPFDDLIAKKVKDYCFYNKYETINTHPVNYYARDDFYAYSVFRIINNRGHHFGGEKPSINRPEINYFQSDKFSFENFCKLNNTKFIPYN